MAKHDAAAEDELSDAANGADSIAESATDDLDTLDHEAEAEEESPSDVKRMSSASVAMLVGLVIVVVAVALTGFLGYRAFQSQQIEDRTNLFLGVARQGAVNLTTIDWQEADSDIQRILDSATGTFYDDFSKRSQPFVEVVKQAKSKSVGTVTEAGVESESGDQAQVLVAVSVQTTSGGAAEQRPRAWRMRMDLQRVGDQAKVSNVQFVP
ncbi:hypothetical protein [Mycolicibacterium hodleri]|uniref:Mce protein n=1 Tax=Mycolicibacterium hodleri TaxID=49897 RepID=A0A502EK03_9MYCO|nr:hypothetical protein [Mycolicibacterium hodleri]TPG37302.1 hypothetical protein EAH80_00090 [Mycolicibacterium hodleri]